MILSQDELKGILDRAGWRDLLERAKRDERLPEIIDTDRDQALLESIGISRAILLDEMGGSP